MTQYNSALALAEASKKEEVRNQIERKNLLQRQQEAREKLERELSRDDRDIERDKIDTERYKESKKYNRWVLVITIATLAATIIGWFIK